MLKLEKVLDKKTKLLSAKKKVNWNCGHLRVTIFDVGSIGIWMMDIYIYVYIYIYIYIYIYKCKYI